MRNGVNFSARWLFVVGLLFFLAVQWYGVWYLWYDHPGPVGLDDAGWYMSNIEYFREFPFIKTGGVELTSTSIYNYNKIIHPLLFGWLSFLLGVSAETMFYWNFYIGLGLMGIVLYSLLRRIDFAPWFVLPAFILLAFYEGKGSYHGFSWVTPSFYAIALFLVGAIALLFSRRPVTYGLPLLLLLLFTHSTGIYLAAILILSYVLNESVSKRNFKPLVWGLLLAAVLLVIFLTFEYLYDRELIQLTFTITFHDYKNVHFMKAESWGDRLAVALDSIYRTVQKYDFNKYYYGLYTPLLGYGLYHLVRQRKMPIVWLFVLLFTGLIVASTLTRYPMRFFYPLEVITWIVIAYGISVLLRRLFVSRVRGADVGSMRWTTWMLRIGALGLLVIALLFFYNAIHQKAHHTTYVKYSNTRFFDKTRFLDYMKQNQDKQFVVFTTMPDVYLSYEGMWQNRQLRFPRNTSDDSVLDSPDRFIIIGENHRYFEKGRRGVEVALPQGYSLAISTGELMPGRYRLELVDTGISGTDDLYLAGSELRASGWSSTDTDIHYPKVNKMPPVVMPWYLALDKTWPFFRRPIRANDVVRVSQKHQIDFTVDQSLKTLMLVNNGDDLSLTGVIRIQNLDDAKSREFDLDWGDEQMLKNDLALIHEGKRIPLLWSGAYPGMLMTLEKNFRDVKAFSVYSME